MVFTEGTSLPLPLVLAAGSVMSLLSGVWLVRLPSLALWLLALSLIVGQVVRVPFPGQGGGLLVSDIAVVAVILIAVVKSLGRRPSPRNAVAIVQGGMPFIVWSVAILLINPLHITGSDVVVALSYWARLSTYLLVLPALLVVIAERSHYRSVLERGMYVAVVALVALGYLQLWLVPRLATLGGGWDPHQYRFVSTWFDPNFLGAFLVIALVWIGSDLFSKRHWWQTRVGLLIAITVALVLTQSRSALLALGAVVLTASPPIVIAIGRKMSSVQRMAVAGTAVVVLLVGSLAAVLVLGERFTSVFAGLDPTVEIRQLAFSKVWELVEQYGWIGVGYNAFQFAALKVGLIGDFSIHSRAGADNSWLTVWVTTGLIGLCLFIGHWFTVGWQLWRQWRVDKQPQAIAAILALLSLAVHSQFINSFLYAHLLLTVSIIIGLALTAPRAESDHI